MTNYFSRNARDLFMLAEIRTPNITHCWRAKAFNTI